MTFKDGYVQVYTGNGKGKTTASLGLAMRAVGAGLKVVMIQFMKGRRYSEIDSAEKLPGLEIFQHGRDEFVNKDDPEEIDVQLAKEGWDHTIEMVRSGDYDMVILDEINVAVDFGLIKKEEVIELVESRPEGMEIILTGRYAPDEFIEIADLVTELIDDAVAAGDEMDVVEALAGQLPARFTARILGFPEHYWPQIKSWSERLMRTDMRERDGQVFREFFEANMEFVDVLGEIAPAKLAEPGDDLLSVWLHARIDGEPLAPATIVHEVGLFIAGGAETTRTAISHGLHAFAQHPEQWEAIDADPDLVPGAVEEVLRWVTPLNNFFRRAVADDRIGEQPVERGDRIILLYPSANRDEAVFDDPFTFDIRRDPNPHVAFGFGTHLCIGTHVARSSLAAVFGQLSRRVSDLRVTHGPEVEANIFARAVPSMRLGYSVR